MPTQVLFSKRTGHIASYLGMILYNNNIIRMVSNMAKKIESKLSLLSMNITPKTVTINYFSQEILSLSMD